MSHCIASNHITTGYNHRPNAQDKKDKKGKGGDSESRPKSNSGGGRRADKEKKAAAAESANEGERAPTPKAVVIEYERFQSIGPVCANKKSRRGLEERKD